MRRKTETNDISKTVNAQTVAPYLMRAARIARYEKSRAGNSELARQNGYPTKRIGRERSAYFCAFRVAGDASVLLESSRGDRKKYNETHMRNIYFVENIRISEEPHVG